jgi:hypothetical protein
MVRKVETEGTPPLSVWNCEPALINKHNGDYTMLRNRRHLNGLNATRLAHEGLVALVRFNHESLDFRGKF